MTATVLVISAVVSGCSSGEVAEPGGAPTTTNVPAATNNPAIPTQPAITTEPTSPQSTSPVKTPASNPDRENINFKDGSGARLFEVKFKADGAKLVDADEQEIARFNVDGRKLKIKLPDDTVVAYVVAKDGEYQIRDETQKVELFELKSQPDGDWKLKDGNDGPLAVIKKRDYGYEIEDGQENSLSKSKLKDGKRSLRNADDRTVLSTRNEVSPLCIACLGLDQIESLPMRAGLMAAVMLITD